MEELFKTGKTVIYQFKKRKTKDAPTTRKKLHQTRHRCCHLCGEPVKYNYYSGCFNYKIDKYVFCSWKCIQEYRRKHGLIPKDLA